MHRAIARSALLVGIGAACGLARVPAGATICARAALPPITPTPPPGCPRANQRATDEDVPIAKAAGCLGERQAEYTEFVKKRVPMTPSAPIVL